MIYCHKIVTINPREVIHIDSKTMALLHAMEMLRLNYIMSDESERIKNPVRDDKKYEVLRETYVEVTSLCEGTGATVSGDDPDFPKDLHQIVVTFQNGIDDIEFIAEAKRKLVKAIENADCLLVSAGIKGNVEFLFGFSDIYKPA